MPSIKSVLAPAAKQIKTGSVIQVIGGGIYKVEIDGRVMQLKSAAGDLSVGGQVVIVDTGSDAFIVGEEKRRGKKITEFIIEG